MSSPEKKRRPTLQRATKGKKKAYGGSSVPLNDEDREIEQRSTPATRSRKRARTTVVQSPVSASSIGHDDARGADYSASLTSCSHTTNMSSQSSAGTTSETVAESGSASSRTITPQSQGPIPASSLVVLSENVSEGTFAQPEVWAESRQSLCEALPYYRSYQSGSYTHHDKAYGFLLDRDCGERSYMDEEVVITRAGGGCSTRDDGTLGQSVDQDAAAKHIKAFSINKSDQIPVALIVGSSNVACPTKIPHRYCVMGWFQVTNVWAEKSNKKVCFKFRLEKIDLRTKSWWARPNSAGPPTHRDFVTKAASFECHHCHQVSVQVFEQTWICLNYDCKKAHWTVNGHAPPADLTYNPAFLAERKEWDDRIQPPYPLKPEFLSRHPPYPELGYSLSSWKGIVCPICGRCNSRKLWYEWRCGTKGCEFWSPIRVTPLSHFSVLPDHEVEFTGTALSHDTWDKGLINKTVDLGEEHWRIHTYKISEGNVITHFHSNGPLNHQAGGAHEMFRALQEVDIGLQRFPLTSSPVQGQMLTKHFAKNFGMPYKYIVSVDSTEFSNAPHVIKQGLADLTWAGRKTVAYVDGFGGATYQDCNELLALGYLEGQSIGYHDDGEKNLGPTIATMSLGGEAEMKIRLKEKYFSANKHHSTKKVLPGCQMYNERRQLEEDYKNLSPEEFAISKARFDDKVKSLNPKGRRCSAAKPKRRRHCSVPSPKGGSNGTAILTMKLRHGDMVVMHGSDIQTYYEHSVVPQGKLRFALTTRSIKPDPKKPEQRCDDDFEPLPGRFDSKNRMEDADSAIASDVISQSITVVDNESTFTGHVPIADNQPTSVGNAPIFDNQSMSAGDVPFSAINDANFIDGYAQRFSASEPMVFEAAAQSLSSAEQQEFGSYPMDQNYLSSPTYTGETPYFNRGDLQHSNGYAQPSENVYPDPCGSGPAQGAFL